MKVLYNGAAHPYASLSRLDAGANCQRFAFALLEHFGYEMAPMRSSELWADRKYTRRVSRMRLCDILMFNREERAWGAHLAVYVGNGRAIHLSKTVGLPAIWELGEFARYPRYTVLLGIKRPILRVSLSG